MCIRDSSGAGVAVRVFSCDISLLHLLKAAHEFVLPLCVRQGNTMIVTPKSGNLLPSSDPATLEAIRGGDSDAFEALVAELTPGLRGLARTYVTNALAEEVVQETWSAVVASLDSFEGRSSLKTWIYRILLNKVRTLAGREARIVPFAALGLGEDGVSPAVEPERFGDRLLTDGDWVLPPTEWTDTHRRLSRMTRSSDWFVQRSRSYQGRSAKS